MEQAQWQQQEDGALQMSGEELLGELRRSIRALFQLTAAAGSTQLTIKYKSADGTLEGTAAQVLGLNDCALEALEQCGLQQCLADSDKREQRWQEGAALSAAERREYELGEATVLLPVLQSAYAALSPALDEILAVDKSTGGTNSLTGQTLQHAEPSPAATAVSTAEGMNSAAESKQPIGLPPGSKFAPAPAVYPGVSPASGSSWVWVLPTEVVDSVSRSPCWHLNAQRQTENQFEMHNARVEDGTSSSQSPILQPVDQGTHSCEQVAARAVCRVWSAFLAG
jgi:hypothetical protein